MNRPTLTLRKPTNAVSTNLPLAAPPTKTKKKIRHGDVRDMVGKFAVMHCLQNRKGIRFTVLHDRIDDALSEARRLAASQGGGFLVVSVVASEGSG